MKRIEPINETPENQLEKIADESGLAVIIVDGRASVLKANNNSICEQLYASADFAPRCAADCGRAFQTATEAGAPVAYECHAGLDCLAVPLKTEKPLVAIVGRTFTKAENYRKATERAISGDWRKFPPTRFFENVLINGSLKNLETAAQRVEALGDGVLEAGQRSGAEAEKGFVEPQIHDKQPATAAEKRTTDEKQTNGEKQTTGEKRTTGNEPRTSDRAPLTKRVEEFHRPTPQAAPQIETTARKTIEDTEEIAAWRSLFGTLFELTYREACLSLMKFLARRYSLSSLAWLERRENRFESILATGTLEGQQFKINLPVNDKLLFDALEKEISLDLRERAKNGEKSNPQTISLFPVAVGGEIQSALVVADDLRADELKRRIARFCKTIAEQLEIMRLREEVKRRSWLSDAVEKFNQSLKNLDNDDFWSHLTRVSAELMRAERSSLLIFDEKNDSLTVKAAIGATAERITNKSDKIGERVARIVLNNGRPVVVGDVVKLGLPAAPSDWKYKSNSFISYPFTIGSRRVGVLNVTDKADGAAYGEADLELLNAIAPQVAVLIDRAALKSRAGEFEQLSVTDGLTGLLNRRYLEERLAEEIKRSNRYGYPMSFLMIDVDHFKSYNDTFGHAEGDKALKMVAQCFRETLRGADIAARYGGEEFSILLPQTTSAEAEIIAERVREHIAATEFPNRAITVSIGIASCCLNLNSTHELVVAADSALYEAKRKGRNAVQVYENLQTNNEKLNRRDAEPQRKL
jgi:diguanylate cyclase (GGDEF)-like protein